MSLQFLQSAGRFLTAAQSNEWRTGTVSLAQINCIHLNMACCMHAVLETANNPETKSSESPEIRGKVEEHIANAQIFFACPTNTAEYFAMEAQR